jgi:hypothetical protein
LRTEDRTPFGAVLAGREIQYLLLMYRTASLILSDHCPILQTPRTALGENARARVS